MSKHLGSTITIKLHGGDYNVVREAEMRQQLVFAHSAGLAIIDCSDVHYMDSTAINCLVRLRKRMQESHGAAVVRLVGVGPRIARVLEITNLTSAFEVHALA